MKNQLSDEQLDALMRTLVKEAGADEALLDEIADSPTLWWSVSRKINEQKNASISAWPPLDKMLRWLLAGGAVTAAVVLILTLFIFRPASHNDKGVVAVVPSTSTTIEKPDEPVKLPDERIGEPIAFETKTSKDSNQVKHVINRKAVKPQTAEKRTKAVVKTEIAANAKNKEEIKTEFIALSYARDPESGQIVRVKVPSSMMVSLGLVTSVKTPSAMIDAEVLIGDDGLSRAIRFIR